MTDEQRAELEQKYLLALLTRDAENGTAASAASYR